MLNLHISYWCQSFCIDNFFWSYHGIETGQLSHRSVQEIDFFLTPTRNRGGVIFSLQFVCVSVCVCVWVSDVFLLTKFKPNGYTDFDAVFAKWLLTALAQPLLKLVILGQKSRSQWRNTHFFHNSLLISLLFISALVCTIKMKFGMSLRYTLGSICGQI